MTRPSPSRPKAATNPAATRRAGDPVAALRELGSSLAQVRDGQLLQVLALLERHPQRDRFEPLIAPARPRLRRLLPPRPLSLRRLLVLPFEDLLGGGAPGDGNGGRAAPGTIDRATLPTILELTEAALPPPLRQGLLAEAAQASFADLPTVLALGARVWPVAATALARYRPQQAVPVAASSAESQLGLAAVMLAIAEPWQRLLQPLPPRPMPRLEESSARELVRTLAALEGQVRGAAAVGLRALMARSADPAQWLTLANGADLALEPRLKAQLQSALVSEQVGWLGHQAGAIPVPGDQGLGATVAAAHLCSARLESLKRLGSALHAKALESARRQIAASINQAVAAPSATAPLQSLLAAASGGRVAESAEAADQVERQARDLIKLRLIARDLGADQEIRRTLSDLSDTITQAARDGMAQLAQAGASPGEARRLAIQQARLLEILLGPAEATALYRSLAP